MLSITPLPEEDDIFWTAFNATSDLMAITTLEERRHLAVNDAWLNALQYGADEVIGKNAVELNLWFDWDHHKELAHFADNHLSFSKQEVALRRKDGTPLHCQISLQTAKIGSQKVCLVTCHDITENRIADEALSSTKEILIDALESINEGFVLYGPDGGLIICNSKFKEFYGYSDEEAFVGAHRKYLGRLDIERKTVLVEEKKAEKYINRRESEHAAPPKSFEVRLRDGRILMLSDRHTTSGGVVSIQSDITTQRHVEEALRRSQKMEAIGELTGGIAHDFNNILSIIMGNLELIEDVVTEKSPAVPLTKAALKGANRGADITKKLLNFSRMSTATSKRTSVNKLIENMERLIARSLTAAVSVELVLAKDVWDVDIDPGDLEDVILNLSLNARDAFTSEGTLIIETANTVLNSEYLNSDSRRKPKELVMISVKDTGVGMSEEIKEKIFEPFFTTKEQGKGTGLGLSMVYGFVQRSDGHITVQSEPGSGTTVNIYLPRAVADKKAVETTPEAPLTLYRGSETLLVVDDEPLLVDIASSVLAKLGYKILTATNGADALKHLQGSQHIDVLFSDVIMPGGIDGYQLAVEAVSLQPDLKILMASGYTQLRRSNADGDNEIVVKLAENLLQKPYSRHTLSKAIRQLLDTTTVDTDDLITEGSE